jgi:ABC-type bacteriocin/lantibiotic exporter with double-glycine peptidase domain
MRWKRHLSVPFVAQRGQTDCGVACLLMVFGHFGVAVDPEALASQIRRRPNGIAASSLLERAAAYGLHAAVVRLREDELAALRRPAILSWDEHHYVVLGGCERSSVRVLDPMLGPRRLNWEDFRRGYSGVAVVFDH